MSNFFSNLPALAFDNIVKLTALEDLVCLSASFKDAKAQTPLMTSTVNNVMCTIEVLEKSIEAIIQYNRDIQCDDNILFMMKNIIKRILTTLFSAEHDSALIRTHVLQGVAELRNKLNLNEVEIAQTFITLLKTYHVENLKKDARTCYKQFKSYVIANKREYTIELCFNNKMIDIFCVAFTVYISIKGPVYLGFRFGKEDIEIIKVQRILKNYKEDFSLVKDEEDDIYVLKCAHTKANLIKIVTIWKTMFLKVPVTNNDTDFEMKAFICKKRNPNNYWTQLLRVNEITAGQFADTIHFEFDNITGLFNEMYDS